MQRGTYHHRRPAQGGIHSKFSDEDDKIKDKFCQIQILYKVFWAKQKISKSQWQGR